MWAQFFLFVGLSTPFPVLVTGRPQIELGGVWIEPSGDNGKSTGSTGGIKVISEKPHLMGLIHLQVFVGKQNTNELVKIHEVNSSFAIPFEMDDTKAKSLPCPDDQLLYKPDGKCYLKGDVTMGIDSPCANDFMRFVKSDEDGHGHCTCLRFKGLTTRPVVLWKPGNKCFWLYSQGPCKQSEWLVYSNGTSGLKSELICHKRTCPRNPPQDKDALFPNFWFEYQGKCLKTNRTNVELCGNEQDKVFFKVDKPEPACMEKWPVIPAEKTLGNAINSLGCKAGYKLQPNKECKRIASFD